MNDDLARALAQAARGMHESNDVDDVLELIVRNAAETLPMFDHIGVSTVEKGGNIANRASTSDLVLELDELQYSIPEGPCYESLTGTDLVAAPQLPRDPRWPRYAPQAGNRGLKSQLAVRLHLGKSGTVGGLNLYSTTSENISDDDVATATFFATHASIAIGRARETATLTTAVETRQLVGTAIGILMERYDMPDKAAHAFLWRASSHGNTKVRDLAAELVNELNTRNRPH